MIIDLKKALSLIKGEITKQKVKAVLSDLYPYETLWQNILSNVVDCGIAEEIRSSPSIPRQRYIVLVSRLVDQYGVQESYAREAVDLWISVYSIIGKENKKLEENKKIKPTISPYPKSVPSNDGRYMLKLLSHNVAEIEGFNGKIQPEIDVPSRIDDKRIIGISTAVFSEHIELKKISIAEGIQYLGGECFYKCKNLREINMPESLCQLGSGVFSYTDISKILIPSKVTYIPDGAFRFCRRLKRFDVHSNIKMLADYAFCGCASLSDVSIDEGLEYMGNQVFDRCYNLKSIYLPKSLKFIMGTIKDHRESNFNPRPELPEKFTIRCPKNCYALTYGRSREYNIEIV